MHKQNIWNLFIKTGDLDLYLLYKQYDVEINKIQSNNDYSYYKTEEKVVILR